PSRESSGASPMPYRKLVSFCAKKAGTINNKTISNTGILVFTIYLPIEYLVGTHSLCFVLSKYGYSSIIKEGKNTMTLKKLSNIPFTKFSPKSGPNSKFINVKARNPSNVVEALADIAGKDSLIASFMDSS